MQDRKNSCTRKNTEREREKLREANGKYVQMYVGMSNFIGRAFSRATMVEKLAKDKHPVSDVVNARFPDDVDKRNKLLSLSANVVFATASPLPVYLLTRPAAAKLSIISAFQLAPSCSVQKGHDCPRSIEKRNWENIR